MSYTSVTCQRNIVARRPRVVVTSHTCRAKSIGNGKQHQQQYAIKDRRSLLFFGSVFSVGLSLQSQEKAFALIPDDDDEELIERAKAKRSVRLLQQKEVQREFLSSEGLKDRSVQEQVASVQRVVIQLAKSGKALENGDAQTASTELLRADWLSDFKVAADKLSLTDGQKSKAEGVVKGLSGLVSVAGGSDLDAIKNSYVVAVDALQSWCNETGLAPSIKGL
eukprot:TRINITY_DN3466_c0_g1_i2.p1 TRINITY_DN3466_c0_g1~~TRINITY_DN3466_c0_g1_i2.p1  ORF type:complete len:222 (+),score=24.32 TRINITY_DN3466_c0_g1_i2:77-742(+)